MARTTSKNGRTKAVRNNPNGANQYRPDPRQALCLAYKLDPKSPTFGNMSASGVAAGFEEQYARNLLNLAPEWLSKKLDGHKALRLLEKAERNIEEVLDLPSQVQAMGAFGPLYEKIEVKKGKKTVTQRVPVMSYATGLIKVKSDASKFVAERAGKETWGETPKEGAKTLIIMVSGESAQRYGVRPTPHTETGSA